jgi:Protein of unknown function (DUF4446)
VELLSGFYQQAALYLWIVLALSVAILASWINSVRKRTNRIMEAHNALVDGGDSDITSILMARINRLEDASSRLGTLAQLCQQLEREVNSGIRRVGLVRFSPFDDTAGDQSFALALLDADSTGVIVSSLHARTCTRVYAKSVTRGEPSHELTVEEEDALNIAVAGEETERRAKVALAHNRRQVG